MRMTGFSDGIHRRVQEMACTFQKPEQSTCRAGVARL